jgi:hypothetical protein
MLLYHDRLTLPRPKGYYVKKIGEKLLDSDVINKLEKNNIIYFPPKEAYDVKAVEELHRTLIHQLSKDPRPNLMALIQSPYNERPNRWLKKYGFIDKYISLKPYHAGGADDIVRWLNTIDLGQMYELIPANATDDPILAERDLIGSPGYSVFLTSKIPVMESGYFTQDYTFFDNIVKQVTDKPTETILSGLLNVLSKTRREIHEVVNEMAKITQSQVYEIPFTLALLIEEMPKKSQPCDLIDSFIKKRNESGIEKFRKWLKESDIERWKDYAKINYEKIRGISDNMKLAAESLRTEFASVSPTKKIIQHAPHAMTMMIRRELLKDATPIEDVESVYPKNHSSHIAHILKLGKAGITASKQLEDVFGGQGREFSSILRYYSVIDEKADKILKMKKPKEQPVGVINMGNVFKDIRNSTIINESVVENSFNTLNDGYGEDVANALMQIAKFIERSGNEEAGELFDRFNEEINNLEPKKSVLKSLWRGIEKALPAITKLSEAITKLEALFY